MHTQYSAKPSRRKRKAALTFLRKAMKQYDCPKISGDGPASARNHFNYERHLRSHKIFKLNHSCALAEWHQIAARNYRGLQFPGTPTLL
jgi:hypothetical protein